MNVLVEEVVVDFDLGVGLEVIRQQHDRDWHLVQIIDLQTEANQSHDHCLTDTSHDYCIVYIIITTSGFGQNKTNSENTVTQSHHIFRLKE